MYLTVILKKPLQLFIATFCFSVAIVTFVYFASTASAQTNGPIVTMIPKFPGPFQTVSITIDDFSRDLNRVDISWSINSKVEQRGIGLKEFTFKTGALGTASNVSINSGGRISTLAIRPTAVDLLWQADSHTPPFYAGKSLHSNQDPVTVVAEPFFITSAKVRLDPEKLVYTWKQSGKAAVSASGYSKRVFKITPSILIKPLDIEVEVSSVDNTFHGTARMSIPDTKPEVLVYENHPLHGIMFGKALNDQNFLMSGPETKITAVPFFFSNQQEKYGGLSYNWKLNNGAVGETSNEIVFRKPENTLQGSSLISIDTKNLERFMQVSNASFNISFTNEAETTENQTTF